MSGLTMTQELASRGYTRAPGKRPGERCILRNGRVKASKCVFGCREWLERMDRKLAALGKGRES